jgi:hypothetical protein
MIARFLLGGGAALALCAPAVAGDARPSEVHTSYPSLHVVVPIELKWDNKFDAYNASAEVSDLYFEIEPDVTIGVNEWLSLNMGLVFEPVEDIGPGEDRVLEDHGLFVETAQAIASFGKVTINAGKFAAPFSIAYDYAPGFYGDKLNEDIEVSERWGAGVAYNFTGDGTDQGVILRAAAFNRDTSFLSGSVLTNRGRLDRSDGGNGNTDGLENFAVALDLIQLETLPDFHFHAAYMFQAAGDGDPSDQNAYAVGVNWEKKVTDNESYQILLEWAHSDGALGYGDAQSVDGARQDDLTVAAAGKWNKVWKASIGYNLRDAEDPVGGDVETQAFNAAVGYYFLKDWSAEVAYLNLDKGGKDSQSIGLKVATEFAWDAH